MRQEFKYGFWQHIDSLLGMNVGWSRKHYQSCFNKCFFTGELGEKEKEYLNSVIQQPWVREPIDVITIAKRNMTNVYPVKIRSYIHQNFQKVKQSAPKGGRKASQSDISTDDIV